jgi:rhodanese-related sulfurtransferase
VEVKEMKEFTRIKGIWVILVSLVFAISACAISSRTIKPMTAEDFVSTAKENIFEITVEDAKDEIDSGAPLVILDVRTPDEFENGHIPNAINIPRGFLEFKVAGMIPDKETLILIYCKGGSRSALAAYTLKQMGYTNVMNIDGGWTAWMAAGYPK